MTTLQQIEMALAAALADGRAADVEHYAKAISAMREPGPRRFRFRWATKIGTAAEGSMEQRMVANSKRDAAVRAGAILGAIGMRSVTFDIADHDGPFETWRVGPWGVDQWAGPVEEEGDPAALEV